MTTAIIVQARFGSTRLPGKVMMRLRESTILSEVLRRCMAVPGADTVCCAISDHADSDPLVAEAEAAGAVVVRGSNDDVLARYLKAARAVNADVVLRVTSDCPLMDPVVCGDLLVLRQAEDADFACNNDPPSFPYGLDCEVFTLALLERAAAQAQRDEDREHVGPWMRRASDVRRVCLGGPGGVAKKQRWTVDHPKDLEFIRTIFDRLPPPPDILPWQDVMAIVQSDPSLASINAEYARP